MAKEYTVPSTFTVPDSIEGVRGLMTARGWQKAGVVYAYTKPGDGQGARTSSGKPEEVTFPCSMAEFARLGITGLSNKDTVAFYREQWADAMKKRWVKATHIGEPFDVPIDPKTGEQRTFPSSEARTGAGIQNRRVTEGNVREGIKHDRGIAKSASEALVDRATSRAERALERAAERGREVQDRARARGADVDAPMPPAKPDLPGELGVLADAMMEATEIQDMATEVDNHLRAAKATMDALTTDYGYSGDPYTIERLTNASNLAIELAQQVMSFTMNAEVNK